MAERIDVFVSSTSRDLATYRDAVTKVILRLGLYPIIMETFNPTDRNALQLCYDKVQQAQIFVGIYAHRYGYAPGSDVTYRLPDGTIKAGDGETGITQLEYLWAMERNLPMLLFVISDTDQSGNPLAWPLSHVEDEPGKTRLKSFKNLIMGKHVVGFFHSPDHLATQVATGLAEAMPEVRPNEAKPTAGPPKRRDFYKHIPLPPNYVPRADLLEELRLALLGDRNLAFTSAIKGAAALHGMGGIGKSVMARALCDDPAVQAAYPDGILWVTLGQEPDLSAKLREWIYALDGKISEGVPTIDSLKSTLADLLQDQACLLIIDDVWQKKHGDSFRVGGEKCRLLLTTRDSDVARSLGAVIQPIPTMSEPEALDLLKHWADGSLASTEPGVLGAIVRELGRLPLAIRLAGAQLQHKSPKKWLERFDARKLKTRRSDVDDPHSSLERCFGMSLVELKDSERKLYAALAIFKEDEPIREVAIVHLWSRLNDLDDDEAQDMLDELAARALLEVIGNTYPRAVILHDLLRDFMAAELDDPQLAHQALLDAYFHTQAGDGWHTAPDDGYLYDHLAFHLMATEQTETLRELLLDYRWLQAKLDATNPNALITDCDFLDDDEAIRLVKSALSMSAHVLDEHKDQLPYHLTGRLWLYRDNPDIRSLWQHCHGTTPLELLETQEHPPMLHAGGALVRTLKAHTDSLNGMLQLTDGRLLSWSNDGTLRLWSAEVKPLRTLEGHTDCVRSAMELADGRLLSWSSDGTLRLWSSDGSLLRVVEGQTETMGGVLELAHGWLLSWSYDGILRLWSAEVEPLRILEGHTDSVSGAMELADGRLLSWSSDGTLRLWSVDGALIHVLEDHTDCVEGAMELADGRLLSWSSDGTLRLWSANGNPLRVLEGHTGALQLADDRLLSWSLGGGLRLWSVDGKLLHALGSHATNALQLEDGQLLSWSYDYRLRLWSVDGTLVRVLEKHEDMISGVLELANKRLLSWSLDGTLRLWSTDGTLVHVLKGHAEIVNGVLELADGQLLSWSSDGTLQLWSANDKPLDFPKGHTEKVKGVLELADGRLLSWSIDGTLRLWSANGEPLHILEGHTGAVIGVLELVDGRLLSWSIDGTLRLWSVDGKLVRVLEGHHELVSGALELKDGRLLSWSSDGTLRLWSSDGEQLRVLEGHTSVVIGGIELADGHMLSWAYDRTLRLWSAEGDQHYVLEGHTHFVLGAMELADGRLLSWSQDKTLRLWSTGGQPLHVLEGHRHTVVGALELVDGRLLSWSYDRTLRLWSPEGKGLGVLNNWRQDEAHLSAWAAEQSFDVRVLFESDLRNPRSPFVRVNRAHLFVHQVSQFIGDADFTKPVVCGRTIAVGDAHGRVIFLRVRETD